MPSYFLLCAPTYKRIAIIAVAVSLPVLIAGQGLAADRKGDLFMLATTHTDSCIAYLHIQCYLFRTQVTDSSGSSGCLLDASNSYHDFNHVSKHAIKFE